MLPRNPRSRGLLGAFANPLTMGGLGMLSQGPNLAPINPWQGLAGGMMMGGQMQNQLASLDLERQKLEAARGGRERAAEILGEIGDYREMAGPLLPGQERPVVEGMSPEAGARALMSTPGYEKIGADMYADIQKAAQPPKPPALQLEAEWFQSAPEESKAAALELKRAGAMTIKEAITPVGDKADEYVLPNGEMPSPMMTVADIVAAGGRVVDEAEKVTARKRAEFEEGMRQGQEQIAEAEAEYAAAKEQILQGDWTAGARRKLEQAGRRVGLARQMVWNNQRELSGRAQEAISEPGFLRMMQEETEKWWAENITGEGEAGNAPESAGIPTIRIDPNEAPTPEEQRKREDLFRRYGLSP